VSHPYNSKLGGESGTSVNSASHTVEIKVKSNTGTELPVEHMHKPVEIIIKRSGSESSDVLLNDNLPSDKTFSLVYNTYNVTQPNASFHMEITPESFTIQYLVLIGYNAFPRLAEPQYYEHIMLVPEVLGSISND